MREHDKQKLPAELLDFARTLRKHQTDAEQLLWQLLRGRRFLGLKFRRQHPVKPYVLDFYCHELKLAVEVDGGQHNEHEQQRKDERRTAFLERQGITVVRYWADIVLKDTTPVLQDLYEQIQRLRISFGVLPSPPTPLPEGEGRSAAPNSKPLSLWGRSWCEGMLPPEDILRQFPDRFQDSELGPIPEGWRVKSLFELFELIGGGTPKTSVPEYWNGDIPWFSVVDAPNPTDVFVIDTEKRITQLGVERSSTKILPVGRTIISARCTVGKCALVGVPMAMNQSCYGIQGREGVSDAFTYYMIRFQVSDLQRSGHGSVFNTITRETFKSITIPFSGANLTQQFEGFISDFMDQILHNLFQIDTLAKLRDTLLPKLISGELRVPDAEKLVEDAL